MNKRPFRINGKGVVVKAENAVYANTNMPNVEDAKGALDNLNERVGELEEQGSGGGGSSSGDISLTTEYRRNLYRKEDRILDKTLSLMEEWYGVPTNMTGYSIVYIPVKADTDYIIYHHDGRFQQSGNFAKMLYVFCDSSKNKISAHHFGYYAGGLDADTGEAIVMQVDDCETTIDVHHRRLHTPLNCAYLLMCVKYDYSGGSDYTDTLYVEEGTWPSEIDGNEMCVTKINGMPIYANDNKRQKKYDVDQDVYIAGDSIGTFYAGHWNNILNKYSFKSLHNIAIGGSYWGFSEQTSWAWVADGADYISTKNINSRTWTDNVVAAQVYRLIDRVENHGWPAPELMLIHAGTNDINFERALGNADNVFNFDTTGYGVDDFKTIIANVDSAANGGTLSSLSVPSQLQSTIGGIRFTLELLWSHFPYCKVVLTTPLHRSNVSVNAKIMLMRDQIVRACAHLAVPCFDLGSECNFYTPFHENYLGDGLHPDTAHGGKLLADLIGRYLVSHYGGKDWFKIS